MRIREATAGSRFPTPSVDSADFTCPITGGGAAKKDRFLDGRFRLVELLHRGDGLFPAIRGGLLRGLGRLEGEQEYEGSGKRAHYSLGFWHCQLWVSDDHCNAWPGVRTGPERPDFAGRGNGLVAGWDIGISP